MEDFSGEKIEGKLSAFREEVRNLVEEEARAGKTAHFQYPDFTVDDLNEQDMDMWGAVKGGFATPESFDVYEKSIIVFESDRPTFKLLPGVPPSRGHFKGFIANKAAILFVEKELEEEEGPRQ